MSCKWLAVSPPSQVLCTVREMMIHSLTDSTRSISAERIRVCLLEAFRDMYVHSRNITFVYSIKRQPEALPCVAKKKVTSNVSRLLSTTQILQDTLWVRSQPCRGRHSGCCTVPADLLAWEIVPWLPICISTTLLTPI